MNLQDQSATVDAILYLSGGARAAMEIPGLLQKRLGTRFVGALLASGRADILLHLRGTERDLGNDILDLQRQILAPEIHFHGSHTVLRSDPPHAVEAYQITTLHDKMPEASPWEATRQVPHPLRCIVDVHVRRPRQTHDENAEITAIVATIARMPGVDYVARVENRWRLIVHASFGDSLDFASFLLDKLQFDERIERTETHFILPMPAAPAHVSFDQALPEERDHRPLDTFVFVKVGHWDTSSVVTDIRKFLGDVHARHAHASIVYSDTDIIVYFPHRAEGWGAEVFKLMTSRLGEGRRIPDEVQLIQVRRTEGFSPGEGPVRAYLVIDVKNPWKQTIPRLVNALKEDDASSIEYLGEAVNRPRLLARVHAKDIASLTDLVVEHFRNRRDHPVIQSTGTYIVAEESTHEKSETVEPHGPTEILLKAIAAEGEGGAPVKRVLKGARKLASTLNAPFDSDSLRRTLSTWTRKGHLDVESWEAKGETWVKLRKRAAPPSSGSSG